MNLLAGFVKVHFQEPLEVSWQLSISTRNYLGQDSGDQSVWNVTSTEPTLAGDALSPINIPVPLNSSFSKQWKNRVPTSIRSLQTLCSKGRRISSCQCNHVGVGYSHRGKLMKISTAPSMSWSHDGSVTVCGARWVPLAFLLKM